MITFFNIVSLLCWACVCSSSPLVSGRTPVTLNLERVSVKTNNTEGSTIKIYERAKEPFRSRELLFKEALGLQTGKAFNLDLSKWRMLQNCGLYKDLSARTISKDGEVTLEVSGQELPSITFSPEVQLGASLDSPEVAGGVVLKDRNFRGIGEQFELVVSAFKEGMEKGVKSLPPSFNIKWIDGIAGRPNSVTMTWDEEHTLEKSTDIGGRKSLADKLQVMQRSVSIKMAGVRTLEGKDGDLLSGSGLKYSLEPFHCDIKPSEVSEIDKSSTLSGARWKFTHFPKPSLPKWPSVSYQHEVGYNRRGDWSGAIEPYQTMAVELVSPNIVLHECIDVAGNATHDPQGLKAYFKLKWNSFASRGPGRVPLKHFANFQNPKYVRGFDTATAFKVTESSHERDYKSSMSAYSVIKGDIGFIGVVPWGTPGVFVDTALLRKANGGDDGCTNRWGLSNPDGLLGHITSGVSLRAAGFRVDIGWPVLRKVRPKLYVGLDDEGY